MAIERAERRAAEALAAAASCTDYHNDNVRRRKSSERVSDIDNKNVEDTDVDPRNTERGELLRPAQVASARAKGNSASNDRRRTVWGRGKKFLPLRGRGTIWAHCVAGIRHAAREKMDRHTGPAIGKQTEQLRSPERAECVGRTPYGTRGRVALLWRRPKSKKGQDNRGSFGGRLFATPEPNDVEKALNILDLMKAHAFDATLASPSPNLRVKKVRKT